MKDDESFSHKVIMAVLACGAFGLCILYWLTHFQKATLPIAKVEPPKQCPTEPLLTAASKEIVKRHWIHNRIINNNSLLSGYASIVQIISLPLIIIGLIIGYYQLKDYVAVPNLALEFEFTNPKELSYYVINYSYKVADNVFVAFDIRDLDRGDPNIPFTLNPHNHGFVNPETKQGPTPIIIGGWNQNQTHRYFGIVYVNCKGGIRRSYWIYVHQSVPNESFYAKRNDDITPIPADLSTNTEKRLLQLVPIEQRKQMHD